MAKVWTVLVVLIVAFVVIPANVSASDLDGTQWKIRPEGLRGFLLFWQTDTLKFYSGKFESVDCVPLGFMPGPYESKKAGNEIAWSATQTNDKGEKMQWQGSLSGGRLTGSYTWTKTNGKVVTIHWKAKRTG
jgi:hypothetical protein